MPNRKLTYGVLTFLFVLNLIFSGIIFYSQNQKLKVIFFDVDQGDSILISRGGNQILIDGGPEAQKELEKLGKYIPFWDRKIELVIATHPDQDHIGGLAGVMKNYAIGQVIDNGMESESQVYENYLATIKGKNTGRLQGRRGMNIKLAEANLELLYPGQNFQVNSKDTNAGSLVSKLTYGQNSFLFTGDFPSEKEGDVFASGADLTAKVLKVAHHGSKYSTSSEFLAKVEPEDAVVSVGKSNRYGHPAPEIMERLKNKSINILRTDEKGDINYVCESVQRQCFKE